MFESEHFIFNDNQDIEKMCSVKTCHWYLSICLVCKFQWFHRNIGIKGRNIFIGVTFLSRPSTKHDHLNPWSPPPQPCWWVRERERESYILNILILCMAALHIWITYNPILQSWTLHFSWNPDWLLLLRPGILQQLPLPRIQQLHLHPPDQRRGQRKEEESVYHWQPNE